MNRQIEKVLSSALELLADDVVIKCLEDSTFVTHVEYAENKSCVLIDYQSKMEQKDYKAFCDHSTKLFDKFMEIPTWYNA